MINACVIGLGKRGYNLISKILLNNKDLNIVAVCDVYADRIAQAVECIREHGGAPKGFTDYKEALNTGNTGLYESAFHPSFSAQYRTTYPDLSTTLRDLLSVASEKNRTELGELKSIRYQITASREQELSSLEAYYGYTGLDAFLYEMPLEAISAMREISLRITFEGSLDDFTAELTYRVLCIDGFWYLHPEAFGTVLRNE